MAIKDRDNYMNIGISKINCYYGLLALISSVGTVLAFHHCIMGLITSVCLWDGYGSQVGHGGFSQVSDTYLGFLHQYWPHIFTNEHTDGAQLQAVCTVSVIMPVQYRTSVTIQLFIVFMLICWHLQKKNSYFFFFLQSIKQLASALSDVKLKENSLIRILWPKNKCRLLREDVVLVDR